jgi:MFS family permease
MSFLTKNLKISSRKLAAVTLLNSGTFAWFFVIIINIEDVFKKITLGDPFWGEGGFCQLLFFGFAIFWAIVGSFVGRKIDRRKLLFSWIMLGVFTTILLDLIQGIELAVIASFLLGVSLGLGLPTTTALVADYTYTEERARVSGIVILGTFILAFIALGAIQMLDLELFNIVLILAAVRAISLLALIIDKCDITEKVEDLSQAINFTSFAMYIFPWAMFAIAAGLAWNIIPEEYTSEIAVGSAIRSAFIAVFGLIWGILADRIGRKWPIIIGLIMLGIGFNVLAFDLTGITVIIYFALAGVAWGCFFVMFLAIPGDLSGKGSREKFYGMGYILPLAILFALSIVPLPIIRIFPANSFAQILSAILFLSILPVYRAEDTLKEGKIRERKMKDYVEKIAKEIVEEEQDS